jgi:ADP-heptose:LPS heptosyltransferase
VNAREIVFIPLTKLVTRIVNALDATDATTQVVKDAKTIARKLQGKRAEKLPPPPPPPPTPAMIVLPSPSPSPLPTPLPVTPIHISASQMSFDNRIENFSKLITLLTNEPLYAPNETDLKLIALNTLLTSLKNTNTAVVNGTTLLSNARIARNTMLYAIGTGLVDIAAEVKKYVKSIFGATSPQYKQVSGLKFNRIKV